YPADAGINQWVRTVRLNRGEDIQVIDDFDLNKQERHIQLTLMTACEVNLGQPGMISLSNTSGVQSAQLQIGFNSQKLKVDFEEIKIEDANLKTVWGDRITRILLTSNGPAQKDIWILKFFP
ncbi:MAG TPA: hypothetical protein VGD14_03505, partial [bacterium]